MTELEKFADALPQMQIIRDFLDWCEEQKREIAEPTPSGYRLMPINETRSAMLARYFGFDPVKLEDERRELLLKHSALAGKAHGGDGHSGRQPSQSDKQERCTEYCEHDLDKAEPCNVCPLRSVSITVGGSTHIRAAQDWLNLARASLSSLAESVRCETTLTMRYPIGCSCGSIGSGIGPCATWDPSRNPERCVYCDHIEACHHKVAPWLEAKAGRLERELAAAKQTISVMAGGAWPDTSRFPRRGFSDGCSCNGDEPCQKCGAHIGCKCHPSQAMNEEGS